MAPLILKKIFTFKQAYLASNQLKKRSKLLDKINNHISLTDKINPLGDTLIHFVITSGQPLDIEYLLNKLTPGQIDIQNDFGETPLMQAAREGRQTIVSLLMLYRASIDLKDNEGKTIADYQALSAKPVTLAPSLLIHQLPVIYDNIQAITGEDDIRCLHEYLTMNGIDFNQAIDRDDNTIAFHVLLVCTLEGLKAFLPYLTFSMLASRNCEGKTPLHLLIERNLYVKANIIIHTGASIDCQDFNQRTPLDYATEKNTPLKGKSISAYFAFNEVCEHFSMHLDYKQLLADIHHLGFGLDEGTDELNNTPLHNLVKFLPYPAIEYILANYNDCQLDCLNAMGVSIRDMADQDDRRCVVQLLTQYLTPNSTVSYQLPYSTVYQDLQALFKNNHSPLDEDNEIVIKHFLTYVNYFRRNRYRYHGTVRDGHVLDGVSGQSYVVNCYDLTIGFGFLLRENGFTNIKVYRYSNIESRRFSNKGPLVGDYVCFDPVAHRNKFLHQDFYSFDVHYVLQVGQRFFDPTFCCHYDNVDDILSMPSTANEIKERSIIITIDYPSASNQNKVSFLGLKVSAGFHSHFPPQYWTYEYKRDGIYIRRGSTELSIERNDERISFTANEISAQELLDTINSWLRITNIDNYTVAIEASLQEDKEFLYKELTASQLSFKQSMRKVG